MNEIKNRRLIYQVQDISGLKIAKSIQKIDKFLDQSLKMTILSLNIYIYPHSAREVRIGREVTGLDTNIEGVLDLFSTDYCESVILQEYESKITPILMESLKTQAFRIEICLKSPDLGQIMILES